MTNFAKIQADSYEEFLVKCPHCGTVETKPKDRAWVICSKCQTALDIMNKVDMAKFADLVKRAYESLKQEGRQWIANWTTLKELWEKIHVIEPKLRPREFKKLLWHLHQTDFYRYHLARGSSVTPYTKRYGIHTKDGIYFYFKIRDEQ